MQSSEGMSKVLVRLARLTAVLTLILLWVGCGDTFRPIAIPIIPAPPDPQDTHFVFFLSDSGTSFPVGNAPATQIPNPGGITRVDVSGDSNVGVGQMGVGPVHAVLLPTGNSVYVANGLENTVSTISSATPTTVTTISMGAGAMPVFVASVEATNVYVANAGTNSVGVIAIANNAVVQTVPVGFSPVALVEIPNAKKVYAVGGTSGVVSINTQDKSLNPPVTDASLNLPIWALASADSRRVFVLNQGSGMLTSIDTFSDAVVGSVPVGTGANYMFYDKTLNRIYVTNPTSRSVVVLAATVDPPQVLSTVSLTTVPGSLCASACTPSTIAVLPDGTRAYVASFAPSTTVDSTGATVPAIAVETAVISTQNNTLTKVIPTSVAALDTTNATGCGTTQTIPTQQGNPSVRFRVFTAAAGGGSRVYVASCDLGATSIIRTSDDTLVVAPIDPNNPTAPPPPVVIPAPLSGFPPLSGATTPPRQNPVFVLAGP